VGLFIKLKGVFMKTERQLKAILASQLHPSFDLRGAGYSASELRVAGYTASDLFDAGYSASDLLEVGFLSLIHI
jgi:hypothetical protein